MQKPRNLKTYCKYYPTVSFEIAGGIAMPMIEGNLLNKIHNALPDAQIARYQTITNNRKRILNVVILPAVAKRTKAEEGKIPSCQFDIFAFRIQVLENKVWLSCWFSTSNTDALYIYFHTDRLYDVWKQTNENLINISDDIINTRCTWLNYLRAADALACYLPIFQRFFEIDDTSSINYDDEPLKYIIAYNQDNFSFLSILKNELQEVIRSHDENTAIVSCPDSDYHSHAISKYPIVPDDYRGLCARIPMTAISTDEALSMIFLNMYLSFFADTDMESGTIHTGDSYSVFRAMLSYSRIPESELDVELISSLWKAIDDNSAVCTYETTRWESENHHSLFFRCSVNLSAHMRFATLAIGIIDNWRRLYFENEISRTNLDQLLAILSIPESSFSVGFIRTEVDYLDMPNHDVSTLLTGGMGRFIAALNYLLRAKIIEVNKVRPDYYRLADNVVTNLLRRSPLYIDIQAHITAVMRLYHHWCDSSSCSMINNIFLFTADNQKRYLNTWIEKAKSYFDLPTEKVGKELTEEINRLVRHTTYLTQSNIKDFIDSINNPDNARSKILSYSQKLLSMVPDASAMNIGSIARMKSDYYDLYMKLCSESDYQDAKNTYFSLDSDTFSSDILNKMFADGYDSLDQIPVDVIRETRMYLIEQITSNAGL